MSKSRGRPRMYADEHEKKKAFNERHKVRRVYTDLRDDAPINKAIVEAAAKEQGVPVSLMVAQGLMKWILDTMGPEWLEDQQKKREDQNKKGED